jgi:hypothetical protein
MNGQPLSVLELFCGIGGCAAALGLAYAWPPRSISIGMPLRCTGTTSSTSVVRHSSGHRVFHIGLRALASTQRLVLADGCRLAALLAH